MAFFSSRRPHHGPMSRSDFAKLPRHVAIIMDGNGRWAKKHKLAGTPPGRGGPAGNHPAHGRPGH